MALYKGVQFDWPLERNIIRRGLNSHTFGMVRVSGSGHPRAHQGWDFFAKVGTPCYAVADGEVVFAGERGAFGNTVVIDVKNANVFPAYAHLSEIRVDRGQSVKRGQLIGYTGNSGNAESLTGDDEHLHFEIREYPLPGLGLDGRMSPMQVYGVCPLKKAEFRQGA
jgi:murein DD-endopeptidase MepM/ murein hydrolase activator NlpD